MSASDKIKRFRTLLLFPHTLTDDEMCALWDMARYPGKIMFRTDSEASDYPHPIIWVAGFRVPIYWHIIDTLEARGLIKRRKTNAKGIILYWDDSITWITWDIVWKKMKTFEQTKELQMQAALGSL
ncbi:hypothetical protein LCGC14_2758220 [marine sediment metagenome]|uniref:Uncharacterized protein n=1 Tax=marine sediment metagenome TaxID=412755 RepID=A0A0F8ZLQ2_9ZZZZ